MSGTAQQQPKRIQRQRAKGWRMPASAIYVGRPSKWGNPVTVSAHESFTRADLVEKYRQWLAGDLYLKSVGIPPSREEIRRELRGKDLCCWCRLDQPCHADVLLEIANGTAQAFTSVTCPPKSTNVHQ